MKCLKCGAEIGLTDKLFPHWSARKDVLKNPVEYSEEMRRYLSEGDYTGFVAYKELHVIPEYEEEYKEFEKIWDMAYEYKKGINSIEQAVLFGSEARRSHVELAAFIYSHGIPFGEDVYHKYISVDHCVSDYYECIRHMEAIVLRSRDEDYYDSLELEISSSCRYLRAFMETYEAQLKMEKDSISGMY